jgi:hypothetical protein
MEYPPPIGITDIFNPDQFPQTFTLLQQFINAGLGTFLTFPVAQGNQSWEENGFSFTIGAEGLEYNGTTTTWANLQTKIQAIQALSQASNTKTLNVNNAIRIQNGETEPSPLLQYIQLIADTDGHNKLSLSGDIGQANHVLASGGPNGSLAWVSGGGGGGNNPTLAEVLNEGAIADRDIDMDNNDILNVRVIENLDNFGYEGVMNAQQNYTVRVAPASSQGWGVETWLNGAYNYVEDTSGSYVEMVANNSGTTPYDRPVLDIVDTVNNRQLIINSQQIKFGPANLPFGPAQPPQNALLGTDEDSNLQYITSAPTSSNLATVLGNSSPLGDAGGQPIENLSSLTFTKKSVGLEPAVSIGSEDTGDFPECLTILASTTNAGTSKRDVGKYLPVVIGGFTYYIPLYTNP